MTSATSDSDPVRVGVAGLGSRGSRHYELRASMDDTAVVAVCDVARSAGWPVAAARRPTRARTTTGWSIGSTSTAS